MSIVAAIARDSRATSAADMSGRCFTRARAAARAYGPPEPTARTPSSGEIRSPVPEMSSELDLSATIRSASSCRSILSVRQSFASSIAARSRLPRYSSSFASNRENSANASADEPAKPASTPPPASRRILAAVFFMMVVPSVTWPSEAMATRSPCRTQTTVVERHFAFSLTANEDTALRPRARGSRLRRPSPLHRVRPAGPPRRHPGGLPLLRTSARRPAGRAGTPRRRLSCFRVRLAVHRAQPCGIEVRVFLGRRERRVAQQLLDRAQVRARLEQVGRERVTQSVRRDLDGQPCSAQPTLQEPRHRARRESSAAGIDEHGLASIGVRRLPAPFPAERQVRRERLPGALPERRDALLVPLADDAQEPRREVDVLEVESGRLRHAQPRRVEQLEERAVALRERCVLSGLEETLGVGKRHRARKRLRQARSGKRAGGVLLEVTLAAGPAKERAQRGQVARQGTAGQAGAVERREIGPDGERIDPGKRCFRRARLAEFALPEVGEPVEVAAVGAYRSGRVPAGVRDVRLEFVDRARERDHFRKSVTPRLQSAAVELRPFRSIRYSPATIEERGLSALIAPPGRVESPAPGNVGRLTSPADPESAGKTLGNWLAGGVLEKERRPALWVYRQTFTRGGVTLVRDALVGLVRLGAVEKGPILDPWEPPEPASVEERLSLLRVLRADFTPSFVLMRAPLSGRLANTRRPDLSAMDVGGVRHDAFRIADYGVHVELQGLVKNVEAILADGEDLFEAAIEYSKDSATAKFGGAKYKLCAIVEMDSPGLLVQPVHRLLTGFADWNPEHLIYSAADFFETREFASPEAAREALGQVSRLKAA